MTGIGCYGRPRHIATTLTRALRRFGLSPTDRLAVAMRSDSPPATGTHREELEDLRLMPGGEAVGMLTHAVQVKGFFLSAVDGQPRLHVRIRNTAKQGGCAVVR